MFIIVEKDLYTSNKNFIGGEIVYHLNNNDYTKTLILPYNSANPLEEIVGANYLIYLVKLLIIYATLMLLQCFKCTHAVLAFSFVFDNIGLETHNDTSHDISSHVG